MNYAEIVKLILSYADRQDSEVLDRIDDFIKVAESRMTRQLKVQKMAVRTSLTTMAEQEYYGLPVDFGGIRDIEIQSEGGIRHTLKYMSPEQLNSHGNIGRLEIYYTIIADQIQISPPQDGQTLEIVYYRGIPNLNSTSDENWISIHNPDLYLYGVMVEVSAFVKDAETSRLWDVRFNTAIKEIKADDQDTRWSGTAMEVRLG